ncbi:MAG: nitroreductase family deazaflavin-dependent oxidoreductase [Acidimicrobiia bacterium]
MPLPNALARFNRVVTNRISRPLSSRLPWFAVIVHKGRVSGMEYRTPVNCWLDDTTAIVALTYGPQTDWLKNLAASGGGSLLTKGESYEVGPPVVIGSEGMIRMPAIVRPMLRMIDVDHFAVMPLFRQDLPT